MKVEAAGKLISTSLSGAVRDRLIRLIAAGDLRPGDRLNEVHWAESFGISRGPVREAARELEGQGLLVSRINQGFYVANFTAAEIRDIYEAKDWMEAAFISDLAAHTDAATRKSVLADIDSIEGADRVEFNETLFQFRVRMSKHIHNRFLADLMLTLYRKFYILSALARTPEASARQTRILSVLRRFWTTMGKDDVETARAIMREDTAYWLADLPQRFEGDD
jgi:DNA-binding GntR family transcriptional regulator